LPSCVARFVPARTSETGSKTAIIITSTATGLGAIFYCFEKSGVWDNTREPGTLHLL
jgi:hypothetical protein